MRPTEEAPAQGAKCARARGKRANEDGQGGASRQRRERRQRPPERPPVYGGPSKLHGKTPGGCPGALLAYAVSIDARASAIA